MVPLRPAGPGAPVSSTRFAILLAAAIAFLVIGARGQSSGLVLRSLSSGGMLRFYRYHIPPGLDPALPAPVVLAFHGGGGNASQFASSIDLESTADTHGFIAVFPEGTNALGLPFTLLTWNAGTCCSSTGADDVGFTADLLDDLATIHPIDRNRIYATGLSNGGMMAYRLGAELSDRIAAIAPVAAANQSPSTPQRPIPLIAMHGALDTNVPAAGGTGSGVSGVAYTSQVDSLAPFVVANQATPSASPAMVVGQAMLYTAPAPATEADIHYWWLLDQGHSWPGVPSAVNPSEPFNTDIDTNEVLWAFFASHPRRRLSQPAGAGCGPSLLSTPPLLGSPLTFLGSAAPANAAGSLLASFPPQAPPPVAACPIHLDPATLMLLTPLTAGPLGFFTTTLPLPLDPALHGLALRTQAAFLAPTIPAGFVTTTALDLVLSF